MNQDLQNLEIKVENDGATPQGRLTATEWNILVAAVKSLDLTGGSADVASILQVVANAGYATQEWVTSQKYITSSALDNLAKNLVTLDTTQAITGIKDFTNGLKIGGLPVYKLKDSTIFIDANLVVTGAFTMHGSGSTTFPTIWANIPFDSTMRWDGSKWSVAGGGSSSGTGGGISIADVENYLTTNGYITSASSITGNAATASKLQNAVSLWGRSFDGSADLTGSLVVSTGEGYRINYNGYDLRFIVSGNSSRRGIWDNTNNEWMMYRNSSTNVFFPQGNIGFGTTSPTEKVTVNGNINLSGAYNYKIQGKDVVSIYSTNYYLADSAIELGYNTFVVGRKIIFQTSTTTTKATTATLDGSGNFSITGVLKLPAVDSGFTNPRIVFGDSIIRIGATTAGLLGVYASGDIRLNPNSALSANNSVGLFLKTTGLNGINNNAPAEALDVVGNILASGTMRLSTLASNAFSGAQLLWGNGEARIGVNASSKRMTMYAESFRFRPASSVSSSSVGVDIDVSGNLLTTGAITMYYSSDERLKKNIRKVNASEVLMSLGGVWQYEYIDSEVQKNSTYGGSHFGLIYQNVKGTALDKMCFEREDGFGTLNYLDTNFISLIAGATMENISEVEKLKRKIRTLENKVKQLEGRA